jgi:peptidase E
LPVAADGHRHVLAIGGLSDSAGLNSQGTPLLLAYAAMLTGARTPRICILNTATGDDSGASVRSYELLGAIGGRLTHLQLFPMPNVTDPEDVLLSQDMIFVGGGSVANMIAVWRVHGVDSIMRRAWQAGIVLSGISAGAICWFTSGTTDSFGVDLRPFTDGLGLLAPSYCPHYDSEPRRRPLYQSLIAAGSLPGGIACEDGAAAHFVDDKLAAIVADAPGQCGYSVHRAAENTAAETVLGTKVLIGPLPSTQVRSRPLSPSTAHTSA